MRIGAREIGEGHPVYAIAEIGVNHDGSVERALELVDAAADAGADAVKTQYFRADALMSRAAKLAAYQRAAGEADPIAMLRRLELPLDAMARVVDRAHARGIHAIVTVFSVEHVDAVAQLPWDAFKTASPDIIHWPLLRALAATEKPMIVSTGATQWVELQFTYHDVLEPLRDRLAMMQCVSCYPTRREDASIAGIHDLDIEVLMNGGALGYSDHTEALDTGALAVRIGANLLEKHLTYDRSASGPDHRASLDSRGFAEYVRLARAEPTLAFFQEPTNRLLKRDVAYGPKKKRVLPCEEDVRTLSRQSIVAVHGIATGATISRDMLTFKRPGTGIEPRYLEQVIGRRARRDIEADMPITEEDLAR